MNKIIKTIFDYQHISSMGFVEGRTSFSRGYVSRKVIKSNQPVFISGTKEFFIELPCWKSTQYKVRQYLIPKTQQMGSNIIELSQILSK